MQCCKNRLARSALIGWFGWDRAILLVKKSAKRLLLLAIFRKYIFDVKCILIL